MDSPTNFIWRRAADRRLIGESVGKVASLSNNAINNTYNNVINFFSDAN